MMPEGHKNWLSEFLENALRPIVEPLIPSRGAYRNALDLFEMLLALVYLDTTNVESKWMPLHKVYSNNRSHDYLGRFWTEAGKGGADFGLLQAGLFGGTIQRLHAALGRYIESGRALGPKSGLFYVLPDFAQIYQQALPTGITDRGASL